jgi:phospholipase D1/2
VNALNFVSERRPPEVGEAQAIFEPPRNAWRVVRAAAAHVLIDGAAYFGALRHAMLGARRRIVIVGWDVDSRTKLVGSQPPDDGLPEDLGAFLTALVQRTPGLDVKVLVWKSPLLYTLDRQPEVEVVLQWGTPDEIEFAFDDELPSGSAQHQKIVVVDDAIAFSGGLDLTIRRWDTSDHTLDDARRVDPAGKAYPPFHDVQMAVTGEAARALAEIVAARWCEATHETLEPLEPFDEPRQIDVAEPHFRNVRVAIARTLPLNGEAADIREVEALFGDMIATAERAIYIENQFLTCLPIAEQLVRRMQERPELEVLVVAPLKHHTWIEHTAMQNGRVRFIDVFRQAGLSDRIALLACEVGDDGHREAKMIHAKVMIVDDRLLRVGSANLANRSMGADSECDLVVAADRPADRAAVRRIRDGLIAEHCGCTAEAVGRAIDEEGSLLAAVARAGKGCRLVEVDEETATAVGMEWIADPDRPLTDIEPIAGFSGGPGRRHWRWLAAGALVVAVILAGLAWRYSDAAGLADPRRLADMLQTLPGGIFGAFLVAGIFVLAGLVAFPVTLLIGATAIAFGAWPGLPYATGGALASALATYGIGRALGPDLLRRRMGPRMTRLREAVSERGVLAVAGVRLLPVAPFSIVNLIAGAFRIPVVDYTAGTLIGLAPGLVLLTALGDRLVAAIREPTLGRVLLLIAVLVAWALTSFGLQVLISRWRRR